MANTFSFVPSWSSALGEEPRVKSNKFGDGYEQRAADGINTIAQNWDLVFEVLSSVADSIIAFLRNEGGVTYFLWTPPGAGAVQGKYVCRKWTRSIGEFDHEVVRGVFEQVFDL
jgi:phage-related protein